MVSPPSLNKSADRRDPAFARTAWWRNAAWGVLLSAAVGALTTCALPHDLGPPNIEFVLRDTLVKIAVGGELTPSVTVLTDGDSLPGTPYRLETLDSSVVTVDDGGLALRGTSRDTASVRGSGTGK